MSIPPTGISVPEKWQWVVGVSTITGSTIGTMIGGILVWFFGLRKVNAETKKLNAEFLEVKKRLDAMEHKETVTFGVNVLRRTARELLRNPNRNAIQSKPFWASKLIDAKLDYSLVDEVLELTAHPIPGIGDGSEEMWEVDVDQPFLVHRSLGNKAERRG